MPDTKAKMETMLFDYVTTYRTDYRGGELKGSTPTLYQEKPERVRPEYCGLKGVHTLSAWKEAVPFSLMHKPRPIVNTDPRIVQKKYIKPIDNQKSQAQATRPRLVMTPAVSMDDIEDPCAREILVSDMYTSDMSKALSEAVAFSSVAAPLPGLPAPANPIALPKLQPPVVPLEWRMETVSWDNRQLRSHCDPTKHFWLAKPLPECRACKESAVVTEHREMLRNMKGERR